MNSRNLGTHRSPSITTEQPVARTPIQNGAEQRANHHVESPASQERVTQRLELVHSSTPIKSHVLNSWKEIARYLGRGIRTAQRWESELRLPVHRPRGKYRSAVIAFEEELDGWLRATPAPLNNGDGDASQTLLVIARDLQRVGQRLAARADPQSQLEAKKLVESLEDFVRELTLLKNGDAKVICSDPTQQP